jgi:DNA excision repair protein ERCC-2
MKRSLFPYEPRPNQLEFMALVRRALKDGSHVVVESGTGSGKTVCALTPCLEFALDHHKKVLYLTRTNSQQRQVIREARAIAGKHPLFACGVQGRHNTCLLAESDPELRGGSPEELAKWCGEMKRRVAKGASKAASSLPGEGERETSAGEGEGTPRGVHAKGRPARGIGGGCPYYAALRDADHEKLISWAKERLPTVEEFAAHCRTLGICPYEANKLLVPEAVLVTAPYVYFFAPDILRSLLNWMAVALEDIILVVDEAHNLPEYAREIRSSELSAWTLRAAEREAEKFGDSEVLPGTGVADACRVVGDALGAIAAEYVVDDDGLVPPSELETMLMQGLKVTSHRLKCLFEDLMTYGEVVAETRRKEGKLPRSYVRAVGSFLLFWMALESDEHVKLVRDNPMFEAYALDPSVATDAAKSCHASLHMSGTLAPLDEYRDSIGLPQDTPLARFPSPFPRENRLVLYTGDVTTRYEDFTRDGENLKRMRGYMADVCRAVPRNTLAFFPSFNLMAGFQDIGRSLGRSCFAESQGMPQQELMEEVQGFKSSNGGFMAAVVGGRVSEGIDFPDRELEVAFLVGIPYPKPTAKQRALLRYYDAKFGKGWEYTVKAPTARKMLQSIGRLIRTETDRGVAVILDKRAVQFAEYLDGMREADDLPGEVAAFFAERS